MDHRNDGAPPLRVENVTKRFFQGSVAIEALRGVSLTVERGEFVAVMGASGSGKSTLLHVIAGLTRPDAGRVLIDNLDLATMSDRQLTQFAATADRACLSGVQPHSDPHRRAKHPAADPL